MSKLKRFRVPLCREASEHSEVIVKAKNIEEAKEKAIQLAFSDHKSVKPWELNEGNFLDWDQIYCPNDDDIEEL